MSDTTLTTVLPRVIHPLDDAPEQKLFHPALGRMKLTRSVRVSLLMLQVYLVVMLSMVAWRTVTLL